VLWRCGAPLRQTHAGDLKGAAATLGRDLWSCGRRESEEFSQARDLPDARSNRIHGSLAAMVHHHLSLTIAVGLLAGFGVQTEARAQTRGVAVSGWVTDNAPATWSRNEVVRISRGAVALTRKRIQERVGQPGSSGEAPGDDDVQAVVALVTELNKAMTELARDVNNGCNGDQSCIADFKHFEGFRHEHCEGGEPCLMEDRSWVDAQLSDALPASLRFFYQLPRPDLWLGFDHELVEERLELPDELLKAIEARRATGHPPLSPWLDKQVSGQAEFYVERLLNVVSEVCALGGSRRAGRYCTGMRRNQRKVLKRAMTRRALEEFRGRFRAVLAYQTQGCRYPNRTDVVRLHGVVESNHDGHGGGGMGVRGAGLDRPPPKVTGYIADRFHVGFPEVIPPERLNPRDLFDHSRHHPAKPYGREETTAFLDSFARNETNLLGWVVGPIILDAFNQVASSQRKPELFVTVCRSKSGKPFGIEGPMRILWPDGSLLYEAQLSRGVWSGPWHHWRQDGSLQATGRARRGEPHGKAFGYHPNGAPAYEQSFKGKRGRHGLRTAWHPNGIVAARTSYKADDEHGVASTWDEAGQELSQITYRKGLEHGPKTLWHPNGKRHVQVTNREGSAHGPLTVWHPNGKKHAAGRCHKGQRIGTWTWWDRDGVRWAQAPFQKDKQRRRQRNNQERRDSWSLRSLANRGFKAGASPSCPNGGPDP
jgi:antitoxin component YwqK of YwqJK toxin-antitoxin module